jgi:hypothetical protein
MRFRQARAEEADLLGEMTLAGVRHWGHHENFPDAYAGLATSLPGPEDIAAHPTFVLEDDDGVAGFYSLRDRGDFVDLVQMFVQVDRIGHSLGRALWEHSVSEASGIAPRMRIMSDPESIGFYEAMGAALERRVEVSPGFFLGLMWYELDQG